MENNKGKLIMGRGDILQVYIDGYNLSPARSLALRNHSPDGFNWGYAGSGPSQLALALLLEFTDEETALKKYQNFKFDKIANLEQGKNFQMPASDIINWLEKNK
jgi:hypothetical protein